MIQYIDEKLAIKNNSSTVIRMKLECINTDCLVGVTVGKCISAFLIASNFW